MTPLVLVDTSGWICFFAKKAHEEYKKIISTLLDEDRAAMSGPILIEIVQGARHQEEKDMINQYFQGVHWLPVHDHHWRQAAELAFELRRKGITTSAIDTLIATLAIDYQCALLHKDSDFERISKHSTLCTFPL
jgi:predicted nucleic acid-binding protein